MSLCAVVLRRFKAVDCACTCASRRSLYSDVRVRFAPSPTGLIHLGGLRTALYNFLFAKVNAGKFILRIEDTDQSRVVPGASEKIEQDLLWAGLQPDESPLQGGEFGPYVQSQRTHLYRQYTNKLLEMGHAYQCFCTENRLQLLRKEAIRLQAVPKYDNRCRSLDKEEVSSRIESGDSYCVRFKLRSEPETFHDLVYGKITLHTGCTEGDPIILKADGFPTYHLACVVDDHLMEISHILRGVEWQISTPKHIQMHRALGWVPPKFGHLPLLLNVKGVKLSKRHADIEVDYFRKSGVFPDVLLSFVTEFGGGFERNSGSGIKPTVHTLQELINQFNFSTINTSSCRVDVERLKRLNRMEMDNALKNPGGLLKFVQQLRKMIVENFKDELPAGCSHLLTDKRLETVLQWGLPRMSCIDDFLGPDLKFLWVRPPLSSLYPAVPHSSKLFANLIEWVAQSLQEEVLKNADLNTGKIENQKFLANLREQCQAKNIEFKTLTKILRAALSGLKAGPPIMELIHILGPDEAISRLTIAAAELHKLQPVVSYSGI